ncbi:MAG: peptide chain release factor N(5)-glutamine methyltransferase [Bdellovibrionales bacterium]|nr:peptide chain release factor N(5)-glutamine methyltransferase [Bdellovibrionales bacterium]
MTIDGIIRLGSQKLKDAFIENARLEAEWFLAEKLKWRREDLIIKGSLGITEDQESQFFAWIERRVAGEPFAYIVGYRDFYRSRFFVGPGVLIPRPETEMLVEFGEKWLMSLEPKREAGFKFIDLGCGTGCIGLSLLRACGGNLLAIDSSAQALTYAVKNAQTLGLLDQTTFIESRVQEFEKKMGSALVDWNNVDLVMANPPYIGLEDPEMSPQVKKFEPHLALYGGETGLEQFSEWVPIIARRLAKGGALVLEHGAKQSEQVVKIIMQKDEFECVESYHDLAGWDRMVVAIRK